MTSISINNQELNHQLNTEITLNEFISTALNSNNNQNHVVTSIIADGAELNFEQDESILIRPVHTFSNITLTTKSNLELAHEALNCCSNYIDTIINKVNALITAYNENNLSKANNLFVETIEIMDLFIQLMTKIHQTIRSHYKEKFQKPQSNQKLEIHLLSILKALIPAKEKNDIIMLCDLLEYELIDNLMQWKITAIPELKKYQNK